MRRSAPAPTLRINPGGVPAYARVERGSAGLRLVGAPPPDGFEQAPGELLRLVGAAPFPADRALVVAGGQLVLLAGRGVAASMRTPAMHLIHDRRPPGLDAVAGAPLANAGLLHHDAGWRAVVLPSLGDIVADLGPGPVAVRPDGRRVAAVRDGEILEQDVGAEDVAARHDGAPAAIAYASDGSLLVAAGAAVGPVGTAPADGSPVTALAAAAEAAAALALHADGSLSLWGADGSRRAAWASPLPAVASIGLSADGELASLGSGAADPAAACLLRARDGALVRYIHGARAIGTSPADEGLVIAGDWGTAWLKAIEEESA